MSTTPPTSNGSGTGSCPAASTTSNPYLFTSTDYVIFAISLFLPMAAGFAFFIYSCLKKAHSSDEFLLGGRNINVVAVALSLLGTVMNGIFVLGTPAEIRYFGLKYIYLLIGMFLAAVVVSFVFAPKFHSLHFVSAYEYIERRYSYPTRVVASGLFTISVIFFLAIDLYVPCLAFEQVTNVSRKIMIVIGGVICTVYTTIGGMRAVIYVDAMQMVILLTGLITISVLGTAEVGGVEKVWAVASSTNRVNFLYNGDLVNYVTIGNLTRAVVSPTYGGFSPDPRNRMTFWSQTIGVAITYVGVLSSNQMMIQRYMSVSTVKKARISLFITFLAFVPLTLLAAYIGLVMNARYEHCDPLVAKKIPIANKIVPYFISDLLGQYRGVVGLLIASIFAGALSSIAAVLNSMAAVFLTDFIVPGYEAVTKKEMNERRKKNVAMLLVIFFGLLTIALSYIADKFTDRLVQATGTIWGVIDGPLAGAFFAGFFIPCCNSKGAISGMIGGLIFALWISIGAMVNATPSQTLPVGMCNCKLPNMTMSLPPLTGTNDDGGPLQKLYSVSYVWYGTIGIGSSIVINVIVSICTKGWTKEHIESSPPSTLYSCADNLCCCCLEPCKVCCRCGVNYDDETEEIVVNGKTTYTEKQNGVTQANNPYDEPEFRAKEDHVTSFSHGL